MADRKHPLKFLEGGVGMRLDVDLEFLRVEFAPVAPAVLGGQRSGLRGGQIAVNRPPPQIKAPGGLDLGATLVDELHHPFPQIQCIGFHARKLIRLCANVNMKCYIITAMWASPWTPGMKSSRNGLGFGFTPVAPAPKNSGNFPMADIARLTNRRRCSGGRLLNSGKGLLKNESWQGVTARIGNWFHHGLLFNAIGRSRS